MRVKIHQRPSGFSDGKAVDFELTVSTADSVADLKAKIAQQRGIPVQLQSLFMGPTVGTAASAAMPMRDNESLGMDSNERQEAGAHHAFTLNIDESGTTEYTAHSDVRRDSGKGINR